MAEPETKTDIGGAHRKKQRQNIDGWTDGDECKKLIDGQINAWMKSR